MNRKLYANIVDILNQTIFPGCIEINEGHIVDLYPVDATYDTYLLCGFIDAHIHIESSMMPPSEFARIALTHGTIAAVTDPHEIANVMGVEGIDFMIASGKKVPFYFSNGLPSCVPATDFETAGAKISISESHSLIQRKEITHLSEVMNVPAVLNHEPEMMQKINLAQIYHKPVDGHAPLLQGEELITYIQSGITTDHEAISYTEAKEKIESGMKIQIREGSSAKNFEALYPLIDEYPDSCMFCSDDLHPDDLIHGHINRLVKWAIDKGINLWNVLRCAAINPRVHYHLESGMLRIGDPADLIEVDNLTDFTILNTYIQGKLVSSNQKPLIPYQPEKPINNFKAESIDPAILQIKASSEHQIRVIKAIDGELITQEVLEEPTTHEGFIVSDIRRDLLKIVVINRYQPHANPSIDFIEGFGIQSGAIASTIAHDSHNIIAVGVTDEAIAQAINLVIEHQGGISAVYEDTQAVLPLEIAGLMSRAEGSVIAQTYHRLDTLVKQQMGSTLKAPYMTLSFMALLVIPEIKLSDRGLFDAAHFRFISMGV